MRTRRSLLIVAIILASVVTLRAQTAPPNAYPLSLIGQIEALLTELRAWLGPQETVISDGSTLAAELASPTGAPVIHLAPGTYSGNFVIGRSVQIVGVPEGVISGRATVPDPAVVGGELPRPELAAYTFTAADPTKPVLTIAATGVTGVAVRGVTLTGVAGDRTMVLVGTNQVTDVLLTPKNISFDQVAIVATGGRGHRGLELHSRDFVVTNSYIGGFLEQYRQSQGIYMTNGPGPGVIENNYIEGSGENIMFGGDDPKIPNNVPSDIVVRRNTLFKPQAWRSSPASVANLFEVKCGQRILLEQNVLDGNWTDIQAGHDIVLTARNQYGKAPWCIVNDITVRGNVLRNAPDGFAVNILGNDNNYPSAQTQRITVEGNLFEDAKNGLQVSRGVCERLTVTNNTAAKVTGRFIYYVGRNTTTNLPTGCVSPSTIERNVFASGAYGVFGEGPVQPGTTTLTYWTGGTYSMVSNLIERSAARSIPYPAGNTLVAPGALLPLLDPLTFTYGDRSIGY